MEKKLKITMLYDFYGQLLTKRQRDILDLYYNHDLSLGEIGKNINISRQGVFDSIKRTEKILQGYEDKLQLYKHYCNKMQIIQQLKLEIDKIDGRNKLNTIDEKTGQSMNKIKSLINQLMGVEFSR